MTPEMVQRSFMIADIQRLHNSIEVLRKDVQEMLSFLIDEEVEEYNVN